MKKFLIAALFVLAGFSTAHAQPMDHAMHMEAKGDTASPSSKAFMDSNMKMHEGMNIPFTGDADTDFIAGMIPHHQGAVEMAKIELHYGKDPEARKLAQDIIASQEKEITWMKEWLAKKKK